MLIKEKLGNNILSIWNRYFPSLFSTTCLLCQASTSCKFALCNACETELPYLKNACQYCALPLPDEDTFCQNCLQDPILAHYRIFSPFFYQFPIDHFIASVKFKKRLVVAKILGQLMVKKMKIVYQDRPLPQVIIPVPLHPARLRQRGFNQSLEIAKPISQALSIPIDYRSCVRTKFTQPQMNLSAKDRASNVKDAFSILCPSRIDRICLIDDVLITGNTTRSLSMVLFKAGAHSIDVWCCARANLNSSVNLSLS